jgi:hypothetical protein
MAAGSYDCTIWLQDSRIAGYGFRIVGLQDMAAGLQDLAA